MTIVFSKAGRKEGLVMASNTAAMKYAQSATYGSAAYDLNRVQGYAVPQETPYYDIPYERPRERTVPRKKAAERRAAYGVSIFAVAGFLTAAVFVVLMLLSYVQLAEISGETMRLENSIAQLDMENSKLRVQYEMAFNLTEVEQYATFNLGMKKLTGENIIYLNANRTDKAEILYADDTAEETVHMSASEFLSSLMEYLR